MGEENDGPKAVAFAARVTAAERAFAESYGKLKEPAAAVDAFKADVRGQVDQADIKSLETRVVAMRRLGVTSWGGIELGPAPSVPLPEVKARPPTKGEVHLQFWSKLRRSSGARIPACSAQCACGAWRMIDGQDGDLGD